MQLLGKAQKLIYEHLNFVNDVIYTQLEKDKRLASNLVEIALHQLYLGFQLLAIFLVRPVMAPEKNAGGG